jgi:energy-coupling factor transport system ATP-binding protein
VTLARATVAAAAADPVITIHGLSFRHAMAERRTLDGIDLAIERGSYVAVLGAAGAGVSTLLMALDGVVPQLVTGDLQGSLLVDGLDPVTVPVREMAGRVGIVFDDPELAAGQPTVAEEVAFGLENLAVPEVAMPAQVAAALDAVGLTGFEPRSPATLSGGERQRLALAAVLAMEPAILVLDEPSSNLDPAGRRAMFDVVRRLHRERGITVIVADPDVESLARDATRVVVLDNGQVVADGAPGAVLADVAALRRWGVRVPQVADVSARLGISLAPVGVDAAAARLEIVPGPRSAVPTAPASTGEPVLDVREVTFRYPGAARPAVVDVSFRVRPGEIIGVAGANGGGKTTLARLLIGLVRPGAGAVVVAGVDIARRPVREVARSVGLVFQDPGHQLFATSVGAELALGPRALGLSEAQVGERVREVARVLDLEDVLGAHPFRLGRSMRKLVALGAVLAMRPRVLVLDEPAAGGDPRVASLVADRLRAVAEEGTAIIVTSHDMTLLASTAGRMLVIAGGTLLADAPPREVFADGALLARAGLEAPQVTRLALGLAATGPQPWPPITVVEAAAVLQARSAPPG